MHKLPNSLTISHHVQNQQKHLHYLFLNIQAGKGYERKFKSTNLNLLLDCEFKKMRGIQKEGSSFDPQQLKLILIWVGGYVCVAVSYSLLNLFDSLLILSIIKSNFITSFIEAHLPFEAISGWADYSYYCQ